MLPELIFHHIGVATHSIIKSGKYYLDAGYEVTDIIHDPLQDVNICFVSKTGYPIIELVEPVSDHSPVAKILNKAGVGPYHFCYETKDIIDSILKLKTKRFLPISRPVPAIALGNRMICFLYNIDLGLIELLQSE